VSEPSDMKQNLVDQTSDLLK